MSPPSEVEAERTWQQDTRWDWQRFRRPCAALGDGDGAAHRTYPGTVSYAFTATALKNV